MTKAPLRSTINVEKIIEVWLNAFLKVAANECREDDLVSHVRLLAEQLGEGRRHLLEGIGPDRSKRVIFQKKNTVFYLTTDSSPDKFYRKKLVTEELGSASVVVTNGRDFYLVQNEVALDGGNFEWGALSSAEQHSKIKLLSTIFTGLKPDRSAPTTKSALSVPSTITQKLNQIVDAVEGKSNEEQVKKDFVFSLCQIAGWRVNPVDGNDPKTAVEVERYQPHKGRLDLLLIDERVPRIVIECKKPSVTIVRNGMITDDGRKAMEQAHRYATGVRFWRHKRLPNIMSMVTNGKQAIWFDSTVKAFDGALKTAQYTEITKDTISSVYQAVNLQRVRDTDLSYICNTRTIYDDKKVIEISSTHILAYEVRKWLSEIRRSAKRIEKEDALAMTLQILFLTVARDHGILGSEEIDDDIEKSNWDAIFKRCNKRFNSNVFERQRPRELKPEVLDALYERAQRLPFSLEAIPVEYVGDIYESLLHDLHNDQKHLSKTSYFTPQWLVKEIVEEIKPTKDERVIDPTCGSAAFLCYAFDYVTKDMDFEEARDYLSTKIFGVDRDSLAVQVSRFALLVDLARKVNGDWKEREHILPKLTDHIVPCNFFNYETKDRFDVALGNPPWGSIDKEVRDAKIKESLKDYGCYQARTDICIYVVEKAFKLLSARGRLGFLVQRSVVDGVQHAQFRNWWNGRIEEVWDFGAQELFAPRNAALTAVLLGKGRNARVPTKVVSRDGSSDAKVSRLTGVKFSDWFQCFQGAKAACDEVYELYAEKCPKDALVRGVISPEAIRHGSIVETRRALFIPPTKPDSEVPKHTVEWLKESKISIKPKGASAPISKSCYHWLKSRYDVVARDEALKKSGKRNQYTVAWARFNGFENYDFSGKQSRIVFSYYLNGERLAAGLDEKGQMIPLTSTTVLIPKPQTKNECVLFTLGWLNSKLFVSTEAKKGKMAAKGGRALYRDYIADMIIPSVNEQTFKSVVEIMKNASKSGLSEHELGKLDSLFANAISSGLKKKAA